MNLAILNYIFPLHSQTFMLEYMETANMRQTGSLLLESKIQPDTAYQKQQETLIVWSEGDNFDLALSFQEKAGCDEIWEKICQVRKFCKIKKSFISLAKFKVYLTFLNIFLFIGNIKICSIGSICSKIMMLSMSS